jgi:hypothetical protein
MVFNPADCQRAHAVVRGNSGGVGPQFWLKCFRDGGHAIQGFRVCIFFVIFWWCNRKCEQKEILRLPKQLIPLFHPVAVTNSTVRASIQIDMRQIERKEKLRQISRLNKLVFGVAVLWLVTSVLLLVISGIGSARSNHNQPSNDRTRKDAHHQLFARLENQATAHTLFKS